jgi:hypothetical protein
MDKRILLGIMALIVLTAVFSMTVIAARTTARNLRAVQATDKVMFKTMVKRYFHPVVTGWGIGLNTEEDSYLAARFHAVSVKTLSRARVRQIIAEVKESGDVTWEEVRDRVNAALEEEDATRIVARIKINKVNYILTGAVKDETTFSGTIREKPDYDACAATNTSSEDCELAATVVGEMHLTRKEAEFEEGKDRVWAGTMEFEGSDYTFVALVNPRQRAVAAAPDITTTSTTETTVTTTTTVEPTTTTTAEPTTTTVETTTTTVEPTTTTQETTTTTTAE